MVLERALIHRLIRLDPLYNFLLTFGLTLILQDLVKRRYGVSPDARTTRPPLLAGSVDLGLFDFPTYRVFVLGLRDAALRRGVVGAQPHPDRHGGPRGHRATRAAPGPSASTSGRWVTPVFGFGIALAGLAGVLAAPMRAVNPLMGADLIIVVFAVVVIGGLGSIFGSVAAGFASAWSQAWGQAYVSDVPIVSQMLVFVVMAAVLLVAAGRPVRP